MMKKSMNEPSRYPKAVLISDLHFSVSTLDLASCALEQALAKAEELGIPLIIAGDLNDTKALIRGEVANRLIDVLADAIEPNSVKILIGNHDLLNEKGDAHCLNFLHPYAEVINFAHHDRDTDLWLVPYQNSPEKLKYILAGIAKGSTIIMHQGVFGAEMGHYIKDSTSLPREAFADFRVISGHYHKAQDIKCGRPRSGAVGLFSYIGTPYTVSFAEANDGPKGFRVLWSDGILESIPTNLRKHVIVETTSNTALNHFDHAKDLQNYKAGDLLWIKVEGPVSDLDQIKKRDLAKVLGTENFKLDKIPTDSEIKQIPKGQTDREMLDAIIDKTPESDAQKKILKALWREILNETT